MIADVTLALERFAWGAPDRLELAGTFTGLDDPDAAAAADPRPLWRRSHAPPARRATTRSAPEDGQPWEAAFVWDDAPSAFDTAVLQLGGDLAVDLPEPGDAGAGGIELAARPAGPEPDERVAGVDRLALEAEALTAREGLREAQAAVRRAEEELARARADLALEREERAADAARFREGVAELRATAEEAVADVQAELDVATAFRAQLEESSQAQVAELSARLEATEAAVEEIPRLREELAAMETAAAEGERIRARVEAALNGG